MTGGPSPPVAAPASCEPAPQLASATTSPLPSTTPSTHPVETPTTAVNRGIDDLHLPTWLGFIAISSVIRTTLQHPLNVALARKRIVQDGHITLSDVFVDAFCTDKGRSKVAAASVRDPKCVEALQRAKLAASSGFPKMTMRELVMSDRKCFRMGFSSLYRGYITAVVGNAIGEMIYLTVVESVKGAAASASAEDSDEGCTGDGHVGAVQDAAKQATADAFAGVSGDICAMVVAVPLTVALNRQMTAGYGLNFAGEYKNLRQTLRDQWKEHQPKPHTNGTAGPVGLMHRAQFGFRGLYTGLSVSIFSLPATGIWWATYGQAKRVLYGAAGPILERMEAERTAAAHHAMPHPRRTHKNRHHQQGGSPSLPADHSVPVVGTTVAIQHSAAALTSHNWFLSPTDNPILNATAGVAATTVTTIIYNPVSVIRTRLMSLGSAEEAPASHPSSPSCTQHRIPTKPSSSRVITLCKDLLHKEGVRGFYKGATLNLSVAIFDGVLFSTVYELGKLSSDKGLIGVDS